jgi:hypothetical protein
MANEGATPTERTMSFALRLIVSLLIPAWGSRCWCWVPGRASGGGL